MTTTNAYDSLNRLTQIFSDSASNTLWPCLP